MPQDPEPEQQDGPTPNGIGGSMGNGDESKKYEIGQRVKWKDREGEEGVQYHYGTIVDRIPAGYDDSTKVESYVLQMDACGLSITIPVDNKVLLAV